MAAKKPALSPEARAARLAKVNVLVADADREMAALLRNVLNNLGFGAIHLAKDGSSALRILSERAIDLAITDWEMAPMDGLSFIRHIRTSDAFPNRQLPIIMLTGKAQRGHVEQARDAGMTEFVVKPFTVKALCDRITLVVDHPRNFILAKHYVGPDRRRRHEDPVDGKKRQADSGAAADGAAGDFVVLDADFSLKEKIGRDISLSDIFSPESIKRAQHIINNARDQFGQWIVEDLKSLESAYQTVEAKHHTLENVRTLYSAALLIKARAGTFGYDLASYVAESMMQVLEACEHVEAARLRVLRQHIDALYVIFQRNIQDMGGQVGKDLMASLKKLTKKYVE